jgi:hypothetical protein
MIGVSYRLLQNNKRPRNRAIVAELFAALPVATLLEDALRISASVVKIIWTMDRLA